MPIVRQYREGKEVEVCRIFSSGCSALLPISLPWSRADSVDLVDLVMSMEQEFEISEVREEELATLRTVGDCVEFLTKRLDK